MNKQRDNKLIEEFFKLYNDIDRTAGLPQAKKKRLERFRNQMVVDFYNLQFKDANSEMTIKEIIEQNKEPIKVFRDKYILYKGIEIIEMMFGKTVEKTYLESSDHFMCNLIIDHKTFKTIVDKVIDVKEITTEEILHIQKKFYGTIELFNIEESYILFNTFYTKNLGVFRALYEFVILLSCKTINVKRCEEPTCKRLYIPTARGHDQKYCKNSCKMKSFRRLNKKVLLDN